MRRRHLLCLVVLLSPSALYAQADCGAAITQIDATDCARLGWEASDAELNRLWTIVKPQADRLGTGAQLLQSQRAWLAYRDATCAAERDQFAGGSLAPQVWFSCLDRLTRQRNLDLSQM